MLFAGNWSGAISVPLVATALSRKLETHGLPCWHGNCCAVQVVAADLRGTHEIQNTMNLRDDRPAVGDLSDPLLERLRAARGEVASR